MDQDIHDDIFTDDLDLDDLPINTLAEFEQKALRSTQANTRIQQLEHQRQPSPASDYGLEDEDVIDLDATRSHIGAGPYPHRHVPKPVDEVTQREQWRQHRYGQNSYVQTARNIQNHSHHDVIKSSHPDPDTSANLEATTIDVKALQQRIVELEQERTTLQKVADEAKSAVLSKAGEIAIVRANQEKTNKEYERRLAAVQQQHLQDVGKQKAELEATRREREKIETSNRFLEHDLAHEAERAKNARRAFKEAAGTAIKPKAPSRPSPLVTPKKDRHLPFRDGFDDEEVVFVSPIKLRPASKPSTPKAGSKRKRVETLDPSPSPGQHLSFADSPKSSDPKVLPFTTPVASDGKFELLQQLTNHRHAFEKLGRYSYPSQASRSIASMISDEIALLSAKLDVNDFRHSLCSNLITLWSRCLDEKYYPPLYDLTELFRYILHISPASLSTSLIPRIVPLCLKTADLIALPNAKASKNPEQELSPTSELLQQIDPMDYLNILQLLVINCYSDHKESLPIFWAHMEFDFVLLLLHKSQPLTQISNMLQLLRTSILEDTFAAITDRSAAQQSKHESDIVDRLTILLFETPQKSNISSRLQIPQPTRNPQPTYTLLEISQLRIDVLTVIQALAMTTHGGQLISRHRTAFGRLVRFLHDCVLALYAYIVPTHAHTAILINTTVHILAHLTSEHADLLDIRARLAVIPGGPQKHLVALSRVAFAEGYSVIEAAIEPEAAEEAHRMLDEMLSPEEGEAVLEVFGSAR